MKIFVYGSCLEGKVINDSTKYAILKHDADITIRKGRTGYSYALPTDRYANEPLEITKVHSYINEFIIHANENPKDIFEISRFKSQKDQIIAPLFRSAPHNVILPKEWKIFIKK